MESNFYEEDLSEVRRILEVAAVKLASERRTLKDLRDIKAAQNSFCDQVIDRSDAIDEDLMFHLKVVAASKNDVLLSLFMKIIPDLHTSFHKTQKENQELFFNAIYEHARIIEHIVNQDENEAVEAMKLHLEN